MPPTLIPAPSFLLTREDPDFEVDFDLPEGDSVIAPHPPSMNLPEDDADEDWDKEFSPPTETGAQAASSARRGSIMNLTTKSPAAEDWDDDEDFDLPPPSSQSLKFSLSPRTKIRMEKEAGSQPSDASQDMNLAEDDEDANASTIKVSRLALHEALAKTSRLATVPQTPPKMPPLSGPPDEADDFEDDLVIPTELSHLSLKPLPLLIHNHSRASTDAWGDSTSSTLFSDGSIGTPPLPSPCHSATASQPTTEDEFDEFGEEEGDFDGLVLPDSLSSKDMQRKLEDKKKGLLFESRYPVRVARTSDGEDDFEMGLVIGADEDLSPSRLKGQILSNTAVRKSNLRTMSEPQRPTPNAIALPNSFGILRPPSRLREEIPVSGRELRENARPAPLLVPPAPVPGPPSARSVSQAFPSLRRAPSNIISKPGLTRWQTMSSAVRPSESLTLSVQPNTHPRPSSPTKIPLPVANSPSPYPQSPSPLGSTSSTTQLRTSPKLSRIRHQKSQSKLPSTVTNPTASSSSRKLSRKASLSSLEPPSGGTSPELVIPSSSKPGLRRVQGGLSHAASYRDLGGASATISGAPLERKKHAYEATTVASRVKRAANLGIGSGFVSDGGAASGSDRDRPSMAATASSRSLTRARGAISNIFPTTTLPTTSPTSSSAASLARSPSPRQLVPKKSISSMARASLPAAPVPPPVKVVRRPKKPQVFGDGTELDGIEDLAVEREKESKYRVVPSGRGNVGMLKRKDSTIGVGPTGTISRRKAVVGESSSRTVSVAEPPKPALGLRRPHRLDSLRVDPANIPIPSVRRRKDAIPPNPAVRKKPTLIRNLSAATSPKVVGDMKWNPKTHKWEGNDSALKEFELISSARPALITHLTGSSVGGLASPPGSFSNIASGARVVGGMMFDPVRMCWLSRSGEEDDPFAGMDDDDDWDADGRGGTIKALLPGGSTSSRRESGMSSASSSPSRSLRGHAQSASESDGESVVGGGRESVLSAGMLTINEDDDCAVPLSRDFMAACAAAEERHRGEMRGWYISLSRRRVSGKAPQQAIEEDVDRSHLWDIRALATRNF